MIIKEIKATEKIEECWELLQSHRDELATNKELMVLKPDMEKYIALENAGKLMTLALYDGDKIVGYSVNIFTKALHYADLMTAQNDLLFLRKDLRKGRWGILLIQETEGRCKDRGAKFMLWHGKQNTAFASLMPKLGYGVQDIIFSKVL